MSVVSVSYTHLDVYMRQHIYGTFVYNKIIDVIHMSVYWSIGG